MSPKIQIAILLGAGLACLVGGSLLISRDPQAAASLTAVGGTLCGWAGLAKPGASQ